MRHLVSSQWCTLLPDPPSPLPLPLCPFPSAPPPLPDPCAFSLYRPLASPPGCRACLAACFLSFTFFCSKFFGNSTTSPGLCPSKSFFSPPFTSHCLPLLALPLSTLYPDPPARSLSITNENFHENNRNYSDNSSVQANSTPITSSCRSQGQNSIRTHFECFLFLAPPRRSIRLLWRPQVSVAYARHGAYSLFSRPYLSRSYSELRDTC